MSAARPSADVSAPETICPFCRSGQVTTASKAITEATYWRCQACGQIWNPARLTIAQPRRW